MLQILQDYEFSAIRVGDLIQIDNEFNTFSVTHLEECQQKIDCFKNYYRN